MLYYNVLSSTTLQHVILYCDLARAVPTHYAMPCHAKWQQIATYQPCCTSYHVMRAIIMHHVSLQGVISNRSAP